VVCMDMGKDSCEVFLLLQYPGNSRSVGHSHRVHPDFKGNPFLQFNVLI